MPACLSLRELYWRTNGRFNDLAAFMLGLGSRPSRVDAGPGMLGAMDEHELSKVVGDLRTRGYHVFARRLSDEVCEDLLAFAKTTVSRPLVTGGDGQSSSLGDPMVFEGTNPCHVAYYFDAQKLMESPAVQNLVSEPLFLRVAQEYLGCEPINDLVAMWWSTSASKQPSSGAAQLYHFDMDWIKFVKFFVYLTDVTDQTGPHCYVAGSHRRKPQSLLRDGRFRDEELEEHYASVDFIELTGPKGTVFVADTRGFHKGKPVKSGNRLMFQIEFAISLFGQNYPPIEVTDAFSLEFVNVIEAHPHIYSKFQRPDDEQRSAAG
jgi:hypothetical protein